MILENLLASLLASLLALSSTGGIADSLSSAPRASAQVNQSTSSDFSLPGWGNWNSNRVVINDIDPESGPTGTEITLTGMRFDDDNVVRFGQGVINDVEVSDDGESLSFVVPEDIGRYCPPWRNCTQVAFEVTPGDYRVRVQDGNRMSNAVTFEVTENGDTDPDDPLAITSIDGPTHLDVDEEGTWTVNVDSDGEGNLQYSVKWGDEKWSPFRLMSLDEETFQSSATFTHTYNEAGDYEPEFKVIDEDGNEVMATTSVIVGEGDEEDDIPNLTSLASSTATSGATVTITGTGFDEDSTVKVGTTSASEVDVLSSTTITFEVPDLDPGTYKVTVTDNDGTSNALDLIITEDDEDEDTKVSIQGVNAPVKLEVGEEGTWTVNAATNSDGNLQYSVDWGESTMARLMATDDSMTQASAEFTHSYENAGTYYPKFTVTDENGNSASVSASVIVVANDSDQDDE